MVNRSKRAQYSIANGWFVFVVLRKVSQSVAPAAVRRRSFRLLSTFIEFPEHCRMPASSVHAVFESGFVVSLPAFQSQELSKSGKHPQHFQHRGSTLEIISPRAKLVLYNGINVRLIVATKISFGAETPQSTSSFRKATGGFPRFSTFVLQASKSRAMTHPRGLTGIQLVIAMIGCTILV